MCSGFVCVAGKAVFSVAYIVFCTLSSLICKFSFVYCSTVCVLFCFGCGSVRNVSFEFVGNFPVVK